MAGGVLKGFGVGGIVLGTLGVLAALVLAVGGFYVGNEETGRGAFASEDKMEAAGEAIRAGLVIGGIALVVLVLGLALYAWGAHRARRELLDAIRTGTGGAAAIPAGKGPATVVAVGFAGLLLGGLLVLGISPLQAAVADEGRPREVTYHFAGTVSGTGPVSEKNHTFPVPIGRGTLVVSFEAKGPGLPNAPPQLVLMMGDGRSGFTEVGRAEPGGSVTYAGAFLPDVRLRVLLDAGDVGHYEYALQATFRE